MPQIYSKCPRCSGNLKISFGQNIYGGVVNYFEEHFCLDCGYALEVDAYETPSQSRELILKEEGTWEITCKGKIEILKLIREIFSYSLKQIADLKRQEVISFNGTFVEMSHLKNLFELRNLQIEMKRIR